MPPTDQNNGAKPTAASASAARHGSGHVTVAVAGASAEDARIYVEAALRRQHHGDLAGALELYLQAVALGPHDPVALTMAGDALRTAGRLREAIALFDRSLVIDPNGLGALYGRALAYDSSGASDHAERDYRRVTELAPNAAPGFAGLAAMLALHGRTAEARGYAAKAAALGPADSSTALALARCDLAEQNYARAAERLQQLAARPGLPPQDAILAWTLLGQALDKLDARAAAVTAFGRAKQIFADAFANSSEPVARLNVEAIARGVAQLDSRDARDWRAGPSHAARHIFLLGYPRSGTTLVEQVLGTIDGVVTLEEEPTLALAVGLYHSPAGIAQLDRLDEDELARLRLDYWDRVESSGVAAEGKVFVDMDPFKAPYLPLIARLFPDAHIVLMRRDPRDVVWSCFRQSFVYNQTTAEFVTLERAARHFDAVMQLIENCRMTLPIAPIELRYEDLVRDFDGTTQRLCASLGLPWSEALRDFAHRARGNRVKTASASQVRQPLFDGSGQWRRYTEQLAPVLPLLERWT